MVVLLFTKEFGFPSLKHVAELSFTFDTEVGHSNIICLGQWDLTERDECHLLEECLEVENDLLNIFDIVVVTMKKKSNSHSSPHEHSQWNFLLNYIRQVFWVINKVYHVKPLIFWCNLLLWDDQAHLNYYDLGKDVRCKMATWTNTFGTYQLTLSFCRIFESPHSANINCEFPRM